MAPRSSRGQPGHKQAASDPVSADSAPGQRSASEPRALARDADKDRLLGLLREHYALGNLDDPELDRRTGIILGARYADEAAAAVSGLPLLAGQGPAPR